MKNISLKNIFLVFLKMGTFSFGGVYSMLTFFERELVEKRKWLTHDEYIESVAIGQMTPGPPIVNTGICIGYKLKKIKGALTYYNGPGLHRHSAGHFSGGFLFESQKIIALLVSTMKGVGAAVVGLLLSVVYRMAKRDNKRLQNGFICTIRFCCACCL